MKGRMRVSILEPGCAVCTARHAGMVRYTCTMYRMHALAFKRANTYRVSPTFLYHECMCAIHCMFVYLFYESSCPSQIPISRATMNQGQKGCQKYFTNLCLQILDGSFPPPSPPPLPPSPSPQPPRPGAACYAAGIVLVIFHPTI